MAELGGRQPYPIRVQSLHAARKVDWIEIILCSTVSAPTHTVQHSSDSPVDGLDWKSSQAKPNNNTVQHSTVRLPAATWLPYSLLCQSLIL